MDNGVNVGEGSVGKKKVGERLTEGRGSGIVKAVDNGKILGGVGEGVKSKREGGEGTRGFRDEAGGKSVKSVLGVGGRKGGIVGVGKGVILERGVIVGRRGGIKVDGSGWWGGGGAGGRAFAGGKGGAATGAATGSEKAHIRNDPFE